MSEREISRVSIPNFGLRTGKENFFGEAAVPRRRNPALVFRGGVLTDDATATRRRLAARSVVRDMIEATGQV